MKKYTYQFINIESELAKVNEAIVKELNKMGELGWELVSIKYKKEQKYCYNQGSGLISINYAECLLKKEL